MVSQTKGDRTGGLWLVRQRGIGRGVVVSQTKGDMIVVSQTKGDRTGGLWLVRQRGIGRGDRG